MDREQLRSHYNRKLSDKLDSYRSGYVDLYPNSSSCIDGWFTLEELKMIVEEWEKFNEESKQ